MSVKADGERLGEGSGVVVGLAADVAEGMMPGVGVGTQAEKRKTGQDQGCNDSLHYFVYLVTEINPSINDVVRSSV